jgi:hypothetical protein
MRRTFVYIVCSPRPRVGKTLLARLIAEYFLLSEGDVAGFDINMSEPSLIDYLPRETETADILDTRGQIALMDRLIAADGVPKVIDLGYPSYEAFFRMAEEIGFVKEALVHQVEPVILFIADRDRGSAMAFASLRQRFPQIAVIAVNNENVLHGEVPDIFAATRPLTIALLPSFLRAIIDRASFSFTGYIRGPNDPSSELHQWIRRNYHGFRELGRNLILYKPQTLPR